MAVSTQGTTVPVSFFSCNPDQTNLFSVCAGAPALDALAMASSFLDVARDEAACSTGDDSGNSGVAAGYLITMAKAVIDSVLIGIGEDREDRRFPDLMERLRRLCDEGGLIANPQADRLVIDDASHFLEWVGQQEKGGAA